MAAETKWYCLRVVSNKERKIKERLELEIQHLGIQEKVPQVVLALEKVYKIRQGKKVLQERPLTPGYLLVEASPSALTADVIQAFRSINDVIHFLGKENPTPMRDHEVKRILSTIDASAEMGESLVDPFLVGEDVKVVDGPFKNFIGTVDEVFEDKKKLKVIIKVFGRGTEVELNFMQVEKQDLSEDSSQGNT